MKKILIVDDKQVNLDAAKAFFAQIKDYEFIYATCRSEAEKFLPEVDAVITDCELPYITGETMPTHLEDCMDINGYAIVIHAMALKKPIIMVSHHGNVFVRHYANPQNLWKATQAEFDEAFKNSIGDCLYSCKDWYYKYDHCNFFNGETIDQNLSKENQSGWEFAWKELCKQF